MIDNDDCSVGWEPIDKSNGSLRDGEYVGILRRSDIHTGIDCNGSERRVYALAEMFRNAMACTWPIKRSAQHAECGLIRRGFFCGGLAGNVFKVAIRLVPRGVRGRAFGIAL